MYKCFVYNIFRSQSRFAKVLSLKQPKSLQSFQQTVKKKPPPRPPPPKFVQLPKSQVIQFYFVFT